MTPEGIPRGAHAIRAIIGQLLDEKGIEAGRALFLVQSEGMILPGRVEAASGYVLGRDGRVHRWWLAWSETGNTYQLSPWAEVPDPVDAFGADAEFRAAWSAVFDGNGD